MLLWCFMTVDHTNFTQQSWLFLVSPASFHTFAFFSVMLFEYFAVLVRCSGLCYENQSIPLKGRPF